MLRTRTFIIEKGARLGDVQKFLDDDIGRQGDLIEEVEAVALNNEVYQLTITYQPNQFSPTVLHAPSRGAVISQSGAPDWALSIFSEPIEITTISGNVYAFGTGVPSSLEYGTLLKLNLSGLPYDTAGYKEFKYTVDIKDQDYVPLNYETHWGYIVSDKAAAFLGYEEPYTKHERRGPVKVAYIQLPKGTNTDSKIRRYLSQTSGIPEYRFIKLAVATRTDGLADAFLVYYEALEPQPVEAFPQVGAILPNTEAPEKVTITFLEPLDSAYLQNSGVFRLELGYDSVYNLPPDRVVLSPDGRTVEVNTSGLFSSAGMRALTLLPGLAPAYNPDITLTRPLVFPYLFDPLPGGMTGAATGVVNVDPTGGLENGPAGLRLLPGPGWYIPGTGTGITFRPSGALKYTPDNLYLYVDVDNSTIKVDPSGYLYSTATGESGYIPGSGFTVDADQRFHVGTIDSTIDVQPNSIRIYDLGPRLGAESPITYSADSDPPVYTFGINIAAPLTGSPSGLTVQPSGITTFYIAPGSSGQVLLSNPNTSWGSIGYDNLDFVPITGLEGISGITVSQTDNAATIGVHWGLNFSATGNIVQVYVPGLEGELVSLLPDNTLGSSSTKVSDLAPASHTHTSSDIDDFTSAVTGTISGVVNDSTTGLSIIWSATKVSGDLAGKAALHHTHAFTGLIDTPTTYSSGSIVGGTATGISYYSVGTGIGISTNDIYVKIDGDTLHAQPDGTLYSTPSGSGLAAGSGLIADPTYMHVVAADASLTVTEDAVGVNVYNGLSIDAASGLYVDVDDTTIHITGSSLGVIPGVFASGNHTHSHTAITDFAEATQDSIGGILLGTNAISMHYDDGTPSIYSVLNVNSTSTIDLSTGPGGLVADIKTSTLLTDVNADQVDGRDVEDSTSTTGNLWTASKTQAEIDSVNATITGHTGDPTIHFTEASINHGSIAGLSNDDHPQYLNTTRGDARYSLTGHTHALDDLSNVTITAPSSGEQLIYDGASWVNQSGVAGGTSGITKLSELEIDAAKNWSGQNITGLGTVVPESNGTDLGSSSYRWNLKARDINQYGGSATFSVAYKSANWTTDGTAYIVAVDSSSNAVSITLGNTDLVDGRMLIIKDVGGLAGTNNITLASEGGEFIDGAASYTINTNYGGISVFSDGNDWFILSEKST